MMDQGLTIRQIAKKAKIPHQNLARWFKPKNASNPEGDFERPLHNFTKSLPQTMRGPLKLLKSKINDLFSDSEQEWLELATRQRKSIEGETINEVIIRTIPLVEKIADSGDLGNWCAFHQNLITRGMDRLQLAAVYVANNGNVNDFSLPTQKGDLEPFKKNEEEE